MDEYSLGSVFEVYRYIAERFNLDMPTSTGYGFGNPERERRIQLLEFLEGYFVWNLENNSGAACRKAREYLEGRGFTGDLVKALRFGFVPGWDKVETPSESSSLAPSLGGNISTDTCPSTDSSKRAEGPFVF